MAWLTRAAFAVARRRDERARNTALARRLEAVAALWTERAGITAEQAAVGNTPEAPMPAILLGLRIGPCQLEIPCVVAGLLATATVTQDVMHGKGLRLVIRPQTPFGVGAWDGSPARLRQVRHIAASDRQCLLEDVWISQMFHDDYLQPTVVGHADLVELGDHEVVSTRWTAHLLGALTDADQWGGSLAGVHASLNVYSSEPPRSGLAAWAQNPRLGRVRRLPEWASSRRDDVTPDHGRLMRADLKFPASMWLAGPAGWSRSRVP